MRKIIMFCVFVDSSFVRFRQMVDKCFVQFEFGRNWNIDEMAPRLKLEKIHGVFTSSKIVLLQTREFFF